MAMDEQLRYTTSKVLDMLMEEQDEELDVDDPDEPIMKGSDDESIDLEWREDSDDEEGCDSLVPVTLHQQFLPAHLMIE